MISAEEAKTLSRENYEKNKAAKFRRLVKESEERIEGAIESGKGYIAINHDLEEFDELVKYFKAFDYKMMGIRYWDNSFCPHTKYFLVWDEEKFDMEVIVNDTEKFFEGEQNDTRGSDEIPF